MTTAEQAINRATAQASIVRQTATQYLVPSASQVGVVYPVRRINGRWECCCDAAVHGQRCWHVEVVTARASAERPSRLSDEARAWGLSVLTGKA